MPVSTSRAVFSKAVMIALASLALAARVASAQYTVQVLQPPADFPTDRAATRGFAINSSGQVLGYILAAGFETKAVLWSNGVPQYLTLPVGYHLSGFPGHAFVYDSGRLGMSLIPDAGPVYARR